MSLEAHLRVATLFAESDISLPKPKNILGGFCGPVMGANSHSDFCLLLNVLSGIR